MITAVQLLAHAALPAVLATGPISGVGIQPGPVCAPTTVAQGSSYALPPVQVADTGSGDVDISLAVLRMTDPRSILHGRPVPPSWVSFTFPGHWFGMVAGSSVHAGPGESPLVPAQLNIPATAPEGPYVAFIKPYPAGSGVAGLSNIGTGVADLEFTVTRAGSPPRPGVCVTPGVKPAKTGAAAAPAASSTPAAPARVSGKEMLAGVGAGVVVVLLIRRRRTA